MPMRLGPGPVFVYEWLTTARRWQPYAIRAGFIGAILFGMTIVQSDRPMHARGPLVSLHDMAVIGEQTYRTIAAIELILILLVAPAATAGTICLDKARGTLDHMLATDLSSAEIVLGKLGVRLIPVLGLIACTLPILALAGLMGGIDPLALLGSFLVAIGCAFVACSLAMALSVYGRKPHEVLVMTYMIIMLWIMSPELVAIVHEVVVGPSPPAPPGAPPVVTAGANLWTILQDGAEWSNPFMLAMAPYRTPGSVGIGTYLVYLSACLAISAGLTGMATARVRVVALRQAGRPAGRSGWRILRLLRFSWLPGLPGPPLDVNPVAWREWHRMRPSLMMRIAWGLYAALGLFWLWVAWVPSTGPLRDRVGIVNMVQVTIGLFLLERRGRDQPGGGAGAGQPRRPALDPDVNAIHPGRQVVGEFPPGAEGRDLAGCDVARPAGRGRRLDVIPRPAGPGAGLRRGDCQPGPGAGDLGEPAGPGRRLLHRGPYRLDRGLAVRRRHRRGDSGDEAHRDDARRPALRRALRDVRHRAVWSSRRARPHDLRRAPAADDRLDHRHRRVRGPPVPVDGRHLRPLPGAGLRGRPPAPGRSGRSSLSTDELLALVRSGSEGEYDGEPSQSLRP